MLSCSHSYPHTIDPLTATKGYTGTIGGIMDILVALLDRWADHRPAAREMCAMLISCHQACRDSNP